MDIKLVELKLNAWAEGRWKAVVPMIVKNHHGNLLLSLEGIFDAKEYERRLHNNTQRIKRAFRADTPHNQRKAAALAPAVLAAIDAEQAQLQHQQDQVAVANRECIEATSAVLTGQPLAIVRRETIEAIYALAVLIPDVTVNFVHAERRAA